LSDLIIIRLGQSESAGAAWGAFSGAELDAAGFCENAAALMEEIRNFDESVRFAAILPGEQAAMRHFPSPPRNADKLTAAARLQLEDEVAQSIDDCHVATHLANGTGKIFAVDDALMRRWVSFFSEAGAALSVMTVDYECLGASAQQPVLFLKGDRIVASFGEFAFAAEQAIALDALEDLLGRFPDARVSVYEDSAENQASLAGERYRRIGGADDATLLCAAAKAIAGGAAANLLQGAYRPRRRRMVDLSPWRRPAIAAGLLALTLGAAVVADGFRTRTIAQRYDEGALRLHQEYFPEAAQMDPRNHARAVLSSGAGASFLAMSAILGRARDENENVAIDRIRFDEARGVFAFSIRSASDADIEQFRNSLAALGLSAAETGGFRRSGTYWVGEMTARL
jgi:type II secretion system protein L